MSFTTRRAVERDIRSDVPYKVIAYRAKVGERRIKQIAKEIGVRRYRGKADGVQCRMAWP